MSNQPLTAQEFRELIVERARNIMEREAAEGWPKTGAWFVYTVQDERVKSEPYPGHGVYILDYNE